jgi:hypothetical protein
MYQRRHNSCSSSCSGCLLLLFDLLIIAYFVAYAFGLVAYNPITEFFIEGMKLGMR